MITKKRRFADNQNLFDLEVFDKYNNQFLMTVGGNGDLYWLPKTKNFPATFYIDKTDKLFFNKLQQIFKAINVKDNKYSPSLKNNIFTFISEDYHEDEANRLKIEYEKECFKITFIKTEPTSFASFKHLSRGCPICFCNSGSRVPEIEQLFMIAFNELAYHTPQIMINDSEMDK